MMIPATSGADSFSAIGGEIVPLAGRQGLAHEDFHGHLQAGQFDQLDFDPLGATALAASKARWTAAAVVLPLRRLVDTPTILILAPASAAGPGGHGGHGCRRRRPDADVMEESPTSDFAVGHGFGPFRYLGLKVRQDADNRWAGHRTRGRRRDSCGRVKTTIRTALGEVNCPGPALAKLSLHKQSA